MKHALLIAAACLLALLSTIGASLSYPILPPLFAAGAENGLNQFLGLPPKLLFGVALMVNPLGLLIGSAVLGSMSDRYGRRPVLLATGLGAALGHAATALAMLAESYPLFIVARFATGLLEGNGAVARAMLAERLDGPLRLRALGWLNGAFHLGWLAGPLLGGVTVGFGVTVPFWIAAVAMLCVALLVACVLPRDAGQPGADSWWQVARERHALNLVRHPELRKLFVLHLAMMCGVTAFYEFYPLWLVEIAHYDAQSIAAANVGLCGVMTVAAVMAGRSAETAPMRRAGCHALALACAVGLLGVGQLWIGLAGIVLFGIPNAFYSATVQHWAAGRFGAHGQGAVMGLLSTTFCVANILMALAGSVLTLADTRLILVLGAALAAWSGWNWLAWGKQALPPTSGMAPAPTE
ncbi:MFS transporter [Duganella sp. FT92W]|uniref:MFS transporter n=1 Tax=Pseudoduganella rivuli TaxID=2666085 RepID=A0A7X2IQX3_9BURK|nr:MFS transporter [Pseudoduganella rivuli]MRV74270.1 MFS transporter [Pseudoduganella rivuli]